MKRAVVSLLVCALLYGQSYVYNPFTKRLDRLGAGGGGGPTYGTVQDEGSSLPQQSTLNFTGAGVSATDDPLNNRTNVSIGGGGGGGGLNSLVGGSGIVIGGSLTDPTVNFGWGHTGTVTVYPYTMLITDNGTVKRFAGAGGAVSLPQFTYPYHFLAINDGAGAVVITVVSGDINGDASLTLLPQEGALLSAGSGSLFYRGITSIGRVQSGTAAPLAARCNDITEAGQVYVRTDAAAAASSLYVCVNNGVGTYAWEGPFNPSGGGGGGSGSTNFVPTLDTTTETVSLTAGTLRVGNFTCSVPLGGFQVTGAGSTGAIVYYIDNQCQPTVMAPAAVVTNLLGTTIRSTAAIPAVPYGSFPLGTYQANAGDLTQTAVTRTDIGLSPVLFSSKFTTTDNNGTRNVDLASNAFTVTQEKTFLVCGTNGTTAHSNLWTPTVAGTDTDGAALSAIGTDPWKSCRASFGDTENTFVNFSWVIPPNWAGGTVQAKIVWYSSAVSAGTALMRLYNKAIVPGTTDVSTAGPTFTTVDNFSGTTVTTSVFDMIGTIPAVTTTDWASGNIVYFELKRERSNASDTMDADIVQVSQIQLIYSTLVNQ